MSNPDSAVAYRVVRKLPNDEASFSSYVNELMPLGTSCSEAHDRLLTLGFDATQGEPPGQTVFLRETVVGIGVINFGVIRVHTVVLEQVDDRITSIKSNVYLVGL